MPMLDHAPAADRTAPAPGATPGASPGASSGASPDASTRGHHVETLLTVPLTGRGISYTCGELVRAMPGPGLTMSVVMPYASGGRASLDAHQALPGRLGRLSYRLSPQAMKRVTELVFLRRIRQPRPAPAAYLWSETTPELARELDRRGIFVVREKTNCGKAMAKRILDDAYARLGLAPRHGITDAAVAEEARRLGLADAVFCSNPLVEGSLLEMGVDGDKLLPVSYGFDPERFGGTAALLPPADGPTFVFVGTICVRKGAHLILRAWGRSGVKGRLVLAGGLEAAIGEVAAAELARADVLRLPFVPDVGALYRSADAFVFPTLEEGGPQVTYEAAHHGLPLVVSPMGAGRVVRDGAEGYVIDPYDEDGWVEALRTLAASPTLRDRMGAAAGARAARFTWAEVGARRREALTAAFARAGIGAAAAAG